MNEIKFVERDGKKCYGNFGGTLKELNLDNLDSDLEIIRRVLAPIEDLGQNYSNEIRRLNKLRNFVIKEKYTNCTKSEEEKKC